MAKKSANAPLGTGWGFGYLIDDGVPNTIIGKVLTLIEVMGLSPQQEKSLKDLVQQAVWETVNGFGISVSPETHSKLRDDFYREQDNARAANRPPNAV